MPLSARGRLRCYNLCHDTAILVLRWGCSVVPAGCGVLPRLWDFSYVPRPALADVPPNPPQTAPPVSAEASIIGVRYDDPKDAIPPSVEIRLRLDNNGPQEVDFDPTTLELSTGELVRFPPPMIRPPTPITLEAGQSPHMSRPISHSRRRILTTIWTSVSCNFGGV